MNEDDFVSAFAPASIGNVAVGYDVLGLAISGPGDRVRARKTDTAGVSIKEVRGPDGKIHPFLDNNPEGNTASIAAAALWSDVGDSCGVELIVEKGIPLQSGMGSSAASAVAGAVAANALLDTPLSTNELLKYALEGEKFASGGLHADNVAPSLIGGLVLCPTVLLPETVTLDVPSGVSSVLLHPELEVNTAESRDGLSRTVATELWVSQQGFLAAFVAACRNSDIELIGKCLRDDIIEPQRAAAVPCFPAVKAAAMETGALGCSLSGSGPSIFALCRDSDASAIAASMQQACDIAGYESQYWVSPMNASGAFVETDQ